MPSKFPSCVHPNEFIADTFCPPVSGIPAFDTDCSRVRTSSQAPHRSSLCKHAVSFAPLLVLSKPKRCFGFVRRNGGANVKLSGLPGKRNGASPFGRCPLPRSSFSARKSSLRADFLHVCRTKGRSLWPGTSLAPRPRGKAQRSGFAANNEE